jgi:hypothetical protein
MRVTARLEYNLRTREVAARGQGFAREFADQMGARAAELARENVAPGSGPGPHPHRPPPFREHQDTGDLMRSIKAEPESRGFLETTRVGTSLDYGVYLEFGWTNPDSGNHWRYPWLMPALEQARQESADIARSTARRWLSEGPGPYMGRVNLSAPLSATAWPE